MKRFKSLKSRWGILKNASAEAPSPRLPTLDPRSYQPQLPLPPGFTKQCILEALCSVAIDDGVAGEMRGYATEDCERFLHTLQLVPDGRGELLEIGSNPYFVTLLLRKFRPGYQLNLTNYFNGEPGELTQHIRFDGFNGATDECDFTYHSLNIEAWSFPFADAQMDVVVFGEVLEHMTHDPLHALREIARVLKPGGHLVLTTPNVARIENVIRLLEGRNLYDPYSGHGPHGRHNREYTRHELHQLLSWCGFEAEISYTANVHDDDAASSLDMNSLAALISSVPNRERDMGQYLFTRSRKVGECCAKRPGWLYRSYPASEADV